MVKKIYINKNYNFIIITIIAILLAIFITYLFYIQQKSKKIFIENFFQVNNTTTTTPKLIKFPPNVLYIYTTSRIFNSCNNTYDPNFYNLPIAGIPSYPSDYNSSNGFAAKNLGKPASALSTTISDPTTTTTSIGAQKIPPLIPKIISDLLFDYVANFLTNSNNIKLYQKDFAGNIKDPITNQPYIYANFISMIKQKTITMDIFIGIMTEYFKALIAMNSNTTVRFIKYYYKDSLLLNEIPSSDLLNAINNNNVIIFFENINIINFLQIEYPDLFNLYYQYSNYFNFNFEESAIQS